MRSARITRPGPCLAEIKERLTIAEVWRHLGLAGQPPARGCGVCDAPWASNHGSLSVFNDGRAWKDHATGEGGDVPAFIRRATNCDFPEALRIASDCLGGFHAAAPGVRQVRSDVVKPWRPKPGPDTIRALTESERLEWLRRRELGDNSRGLQDMEELGLLHAGHWNDTRAPRAGGWERVPVLILTDPRIEGHPVAGCNAMVRRGDGRGWNCIASPDATSADGYGRPKSRSWLSAPSAAAWPVGASLLAGARCRAKRVMLVEGMPDAIAAHVAARWHFGDSSEREAWAIVCMYSASTDIHAEALALFAGRQVRIVPHMLDKTRAGEAAAGRWAEQLRKAGATVDFRFLRVTGETGAAWAKLDLNDAVSAALRAAGGASASFAALFESPTDSGGMHHESP